MGRYGIGARVRHEGDEGTVTDKRKGERRVRFDCQITPDDGGWWPKSDLTPVSVDAAEPASCCAEKGEVAFAVGDRVVAGGGDPAGRVGVIELADTDGTYDVKFDDWSGGHSGSARDGSMNHWWCDAEDLAHFTLEAGKFYRTRDCRKVGPMAVWAEGCGELEETHDGQRAAFVAPNQPAGGSYTVNGIWLTSDGRQAEDIVAEWVEPAATAAQAEPWTDFDHWDAPPEKKWEPAEGDKIRRIATPYTFVPMGYESAIVRLPSGILGYVDMDGDSMQFRADRWELIEAAKPQPKFKVGDRVDLMRDGEPVEQWQNMTITATDGDLFPYSTDVGLPCFECELRLSPAITVGSEVVLTAPATVRMIHGDRASLIMPSGGAFTLPIASLRAA